MKKLLLTAVVLFAASTIANAQLFVGGSLGFGTNSTDKYEWTNGTETIKMDPTKRLSFSISPKIGYNLNEKMAIGAKLHFSTYNYNYPDDHDNDYDDNGNLITITITNHKESTTYFGAGLFFRYTALQIGQFSLFAEASADLNISSGKEEYKINEYNKSYTINSPKTTVISVGIVPGISYKMNEKWQIDTYLGLCDLGFSHSSSKVENGAEKRTSSDSQFNLGINRHNNGMLLGLGVIYNL